MKGITGNVNFHIPMSVAPKEEHSKDWERVFSDCTSSQTSVSKMKTGRMLLSCEVFKDLFTQVEKCLLFVL